MAARASRYWSSTMIVRSCCCSTKVSAASAARVASSTGESGVVVHAGGVECRGGVRAKGLVGVGNRRGGVGVEKPGDRTRERAAEAGGFPVAVGIVHVAGQDGGRRSLELGEALELGVVLEEAVEPVGPPLVLCHRREPVGVDTDVDLTGQLVGGVGVLEDGALAELVDGAGDRHRAVGGDASLLAELVHEVQHRVRGAHPRLRVQVDGEADVLALEERSVERVGRLGGGEVEPEVLRIEAVVGDRRDPRGSSFRLDARLLDLLPGPPR